MSNRLINKFRKYKTPQGFSLIEFLFATAILGFMLTITVVTFIGVFRFYIWAGTTRTNQSSAREVMEIMSREIASKKIVSAATDKVCLKDPSSSNYEAIERKSTAVIIIKSYGIDNNCSSSAAPEKLISNPNLTVNKLDFTLISGADGGFTLLDPNDKKQKLVHKSVTIDMQIVNGNTVTTDDILADASLAPYLDKCKPSDNFCDVANYLTAVSERNNGQ